jgi:hypothetical protein
MVAEAWRLRTETGAVAPDAVCARRLPAATDSGKSVAPTRATVKVPQHAL